MADNSISLKSVRVKCLCGEVVVGLDNICDHVANNCSPGVFFDVGNSFQLGITEKGSVTFCLNCGFLALNKSYKKCFNELLDHECSHSGTVSAVTEHEMVCSYCFSPKLWLNVSRNSDNLYSRIAKELCLVCPSLMRCLAAALKFNKSFGVWGGINMASRADVSYINMEVLQPHIDKITAYPDIQFSDEENYYE